MDPLTMQLILGGLSLASKLFEKKDKFDQVPTMSGGQQDLQNQLLQMLGGSGGGSLQSLFGEEGFESFAAPAKRNYFENVVPGLAERFSGLNAQRSSGFNRALAKSGEDLSARLGEIRGQQQFGSLGQLLGEAFRPSFQTTYTPGSPGGLAETLAPILQAYGSSMGSNIGGSL